MDIRISNQCIITVSDFPDQEIEVNGKIWKFDYSHRFGPTWLKKDGNERKVQNPNKKVWDEFEKWMIVNKIIEKWMIVNKIKNHETEKPLL